MTERERERQAKRERESGVGGGRRRGGGDGVVVKVGERAESSHAGGIVFYPLNWKTFL